MKRYISVLVFISVILFLSPLYAANTEDDGTTIKKLIQKTARDLEKDASGTIRKINAGKSPYIDHKNPDRYVFIYDMKLKIIAHPANFSLIGQRPGGIPDICGCLFRDEMLALVSNTKLPSYTCRRTDDGTGIYYVYQNPKTKNLEYKKSYGTMVKGSDGVKYLVVGGVFLEKVTGCKK